MKSRPILFSAPMVKAILEGRKTQTRRLIKFVAPSGNISYRRPAGDPLITETQNTQGYTTRTVPEGLMLQCPYQVGDQLWVRENLRLDAAGFWVYAADRALVEFDPEHEAAALVWADHKDKEHCPSIHMPRWASRILLEITEVRAQQLRKISEEDALQEGIHEDLLPAHLRYGKELPSPQHAFGHLWESINGKGSWDANPWVWAITFKRVKP
ncbi:hypothetical protein [Deinococcus cellulosilyticus]|uniref:ASCH domain-containing protein n=1 Tax=Deinococcus cellulosilyticus (strain DSM 18568 / NBRC 106333 / KACC 11606 / 5516J-15) TaxID=1223518 RepID=A0A511N2V9_DEIC1|nr:hypothetical protein [Deinococcus cellulosilyticus]GEM47184.1 hypothetical protein DC3_28190 [Deinococcus cellulosilyticus NBRC 106333 = KACC 11606]